MLRNYWLVAIRKLWKHKAHTAINIFGLTFGVASCLIIFLVAQQELSYDHFHPGGDRIYRVVSTFDGDKSNAVFTSNLTSAMAMTLRKELTGCEVVSAFYIYPLAMVTKLQKEKSRFGGALFCNPS